MSGNTLGKLFCVTSFGESHGPAIGCVVDGCPPGLALSEADIQPELDRRKPGTSRHVTQRREEDTVEILSGVFEGRTTGTPGHRARARRAMHGRLAPAPRLRYECRPPSPSSHRPPRGYPSASPPGART